MSTKLIHQGGPTGSLAGPSPGADFRLRLAPALAILSFLSVACRDFALQTSKHVEVTLSPLEAFADEAVHLGLPADVDPRGLAVYVGGRAAHTRVVEGGLAFDIPRLESTCAASLQVEVTSASRAVEFGVAKLGYLGPGHPGQPLPRLATQERVAFQPLQFHRFGGEAYLASSFGSLVTQLDLEGKPVKNLHVEDFVAALSPSPQFTGAFLVAGQTGLFSRVGVENAGVCRNEMAPGANPDPNDAVGVGGGDARQEFGVPAYVDDQAIRAAIPSIILGESLSLATNWRCADQELIGLGVGSLAKSGSVKVAASLASISVSDGPSLQAAKVSRRVAGIGDPVFLLASGGEAPSLRRVDLSTGSEASLPMGLPGMTPIALKSTSSAAGYFAAVSWRAPWPPSPTGDTQRFHLLTVVSSSSTLFEEKAALSTPTPAVFTDLDLVVHTSGMGKPTLHVFAVDGELALLYHYVAAVQGSDPEAPSLRAAMPLAGPGHRVTVHTTDSGTPFVTAVDRLGVIHRFELPGTDSTSPASLVPVGASRISVGLAAVAPRYGSSCEPAGAVAAAAHLDSAALIETGAIPALVEGSRGARTVSAVTFERPQKTTLSYFLTGGPAGVTLTQTPVQRAELEQEGRSTGTSARAGFPASTLLVLSGEPRYAVLAGPQGIGRLSLAAEADLREELQVQSVAGGCSSENLAALDHAVAALCAGGTSVAIVQLDPPQAQTVATPWKVDALASAVVADSSGARQRYLFLAGLDAGGKLRLAWGAGEDAQAARTRDLVFSARASERLPSGSASILTMAASPDGRRLLIGFGGERPGVLALDPLATISGTEEEQATALTSIALPSPPRGFGFSHDGGRAIVLLENDTLAALE